jgi:hypothetical protein
MRAKKYYLAGPMTGIKHFNFPAFHAAAVDLRERGFAIISPAELDSPEAKKAAEESLDGDPSHYAANDSWGDLLSRDVKLIADEGIEAIVVLPGWHSSRGAKLETFITHLCGVPILEYPLLNECHVDLIDVAHGHEGARKHVDSVIAGESLELPHETRVVDSSTGGEKGSKLAQISALDPDALLAVAKVAGFGAQKYARLNYMKGFDWSLSFDALMRHSLEFWAGRAIDEESGLPHIAHAIWQAMCLYSFSTRELGTDDRISAGRHLQEANNE